MTSSTVIRTQADLERAWRLLLPPRGWDRSSVWLMFLGPDGRPLGALTEIEDCVGPPAEDVTASLAALLGSVYDDLLPTGSRVAFLRSRPGRTAPTSDDRAWAHALYAAARAAGMPGEVVHVATDDAVQPVPVEDAVLPTPA